MVEQKKKEDWKCRMHLIMFAIPKHSVSFCFLRYSLQSLSSWDCHQYRRVVDQCLRLLMHFGWLCGITIGAIIFFQTSFYRCSLFAVRSSIYIYKNNIEAGRMASLKKWMWITQMHLDVLFFFFRFSCYHPLVPSAVVSRTQNGVYGKIKTYICIEKEVKSSWKHVARAHNESSRNGWVCQSKVGKIDFGNEQNIYYP